MLETIIVLRYRTFITYVFLTILALNVAEMLRGNNWSKKHIVFSANNVATVYNVTRNASGYITRVNGIAEEMMAWFSKRYDLTYSALQTNETGLDSSGDKIGLIGHLLKDECQLLFSVAVTKSRIELVGFSQPHSYIPISYLILKPDSSANIAAIIGSFQTSVWICVIISIPFICFSFYFLHRFIFITYDVEHLKHEKKQSSHFNSFYVLGLLFSQGGYLQLKSMPYNLVGAVWCIATFVLVNAYNSTLISHVTLPHQKPLINSIYELRDRSDVYLVTEKNLNTDAFLMSAESGLTKMLGDKLRSYPNSRCKTSKECTKLLKSGQHVYTSGVKPFLYEAIMEDYRTTGQCHYILQKQNYLNLQLSVALPKQSRLMNDINMGILQLREVGLIDEWGNRMEFDPRECTFLKTERKVKSLTFKGLSGVFVVLAFGIASSTLAFIGELIVFRKYSPRGKRSDSGRM